MPEFKPGQWWFWRSQGGGVYVKKECECVAVVPSGMLPQDVLTSVEWSRYKIMFDGWRRDHESYLFASPPGPRGGKRKLYWPRVNGLHNIDGEGTS